MKKEEIIHSLKSGKVVLLPTDTVYGLAASPNSQEAVEKIFNIKGRPKSFNLPIMIASKDELPSLGLEIKDYTKKLLNSPFIPGALTLVLGFSNNPRPDWLKDREEVAVRIPADKWLLSILSFTGPVLVTSANAHGSKANMGNVKEILKEINQIPDLIIDTGILSNIASTIVNCRYDTISLEREGQISFQEIKNWLKNE